MKEIPILFSTPMVQAILDGRKTMTRRIVKPQPYKITPGSLPVPVPIHSDDYVWPHKKSFRYTTISCKPNGPTGWVEENAIWQPGDILWVRESWAVSEHWDQDAGRTVRTFGYKATPKNPSFTKWKPSIHMPKSACRIWLEVVSVRVERLQEITNEDAVSEGVTKDLANSLGIATVESVEEFNFNHARRIFSKLWQSINGPNSWQANPFVWVIEFKQITPTTTKTEE